MILDLPLLTFITVLWSRGTVHPWAIITIYGLALLATTSGFFEFLKCCFLLFYYLLFPTEPLVLAFLIPKPFFSALITHNGFFPFLLSGDRKLDILLVLFLVPFVLLFSKYRVSMIFIWLAIMVIILITAPILKYGRKEFLKAFSRNSGLRYEREDIRYLRKLLRNETRSEREGIKTIREEIRKMIQRRRKKITRSNR